ncbi:VOC family protein [Pararhodobacter zhoushanensis]|uniref:VOC family protein n=1 Tax=Pararhodobacter zhoushanensis TaxID=2479545 RepID=A0ABT3GWS9_9RHOB|nr:VOC family protein [Pararhodobacter zhoushanensis]MCW1931963.1 VOC family protein [Pararhodobacter zhoushanensis]
MTVLRIVPNLPTRDPAALARFYAQIFDLEVEFDMGWIAFLGGPPQPRAQLQVATEGGSGTELPALTIAVDDLDAALARLRATGAEPVYGPVTEPWGVRRFYLRDPDGNLVNVAAHSDAR